MVRLCTAWPARASRQTLIRKSCRRRIRFAISTKINLVLFHPPVFIIGTLTKISPPIFEDSHLTSFARYAGDAVRRPRGLRLGQIGKHSIRGENLPLGWIRKPRQACWPIARLLGTMQGPGSADTVNRLGGERVASSFSDNHCFV